MKQEDVMSSITNTIIPVSQINKWHFPHICFLSSFKEIIVADRIEFTLESLCWSRAVIAIFSLLNHFNRVLWVTYSTVSWLTLWKPHQNYPMQRCQEKYTRGNWTTWLSWACSASSLAFLCGLIYSSCIYSLGISPLWGLAVQCTRGRWFHGFWLLLGKGTHLGIKCGGISKRSCKGQSPEERQEEKSVN